MFMPLCVIKRGRVFESLPLWGGKRARGTDGPHVCESVLACCSSMLSTCCMSIHERRDKSWCVCVCDRAGTVKPAGRGLAAQRGGGGLVADPGVRGTRTGPSPAASSR